MVIRVHRIDDQIILIFVRILRIYLFFPNASGDNYKCVVAPLEPPISNSKKIASPCNNALNGNNYRWFLKRTSYRYMLTINNVVRGSMHDPWSAFIKQERCPWYVLLLDQLTKQNKSQNIFLTSSGCRHMTSTAETAVIVMAAQVPAVQNFLEISYLFMSVIWSKIRMWTVWLRMLHTAKPTKAFHDQLSDTVPMAP